MELIKIDANRWEIPCRGDMRVSGRIFANDRLIGYVSGDKSLLQVRNVATLPGIVGHSLAMPDIHEGYGFPIGGVAAMQTDSGVISPGGVGYDINCGVRLIKTNLIYSKDSRSNREKRFTVINPDTVKLLTDGINRAVPTGVGSQGAISKLSTADLSKIMVNGARWAVENGYGSEHHLEYTEENGSMKGGDPSIISQTAMKRGFNQLGTLGSGNHFIELGTVQKIFDEKSATLLGLHNDQITLMIHSGSRGLGHQVCDDFINKMKKEPSPLSKSYRFPDPQLISVPVKSGLGEEYYAAMVCAANFAWANRQVMMSLTEKAILELLKISPSDLGFSLIYDVSHNIAKIEEHIVSGEKKRLCVHRKGATRAFPPHHPLIPAKYKELGQPVIIPGDMGRYSYLCLGTEQAMKETFGSSCHGAGRVMSRKKAIRTSSPNDVLNDMKKRGIYVHSATKSTLAEEMSQAYKDVSDVVDTMSDCGLLKKVARLKPLGVVKG